MARPIKDATGEKRDQRLTCLTPKEKGLLLLELERLRKGEVLDKRIDAISTIAKSMRIPAPKRKLSAHKPAIVELPAPKPHSNGWCRGKCLRKIECEPATCKGPE